MVLPVQCGVHPRYRMLSDVLHSVCAVFIVLYITCVVLSVQCGVHPMYSVLCDVLCSVYVYVQCDACRD